MKFRFFVQPFCISIVLMVLLINAIAHWRAHPFLVHDARRTQAIDENLVRQGQPMHARSMYVSKDGRPCPSTFPNASGILPRCDSLLQCNAAQFEVDFIEKSFEEIFLSHGAGATRGGQFSPCHCYQPSNLAIIIPYRNREPHFKVFLNNMIPFLKFQLRKFKIFIIDQELPQMFNRAAMQNIGFIESQKTGEFDCFSFHDVDLIPEDYCNVYKCGKQPRHLVVIVDKNNYTLPYQKCVGGGIIVPKEVIETVNGFTNIMFGWGGEDDDTYQRAIMADYAWERYDAHIGRYKMIRHAREEKNKKTGRTLGESREQWKFQKYDGYSTTNYTVKSVMHEQLFTRVTVSMDGPREVDEAIQYFQETVTTFRNKLARDVIERRRVIQVRTHHYGRSKYAHVSVNKKPAAKRKEQ